MSNQELSAGQTCSNSNQPQESKVANGVDFVNQTQIFDDSENWNQDESNVIEDDIGSRSTFLNLEMGRNKFFDRSDAGRSYDVGKGYFLSFDGKDVQAETGKSQRGDQLVQRRPSGLVTKYLASAKDYKAAQTNNGRDIETVNYLSISSKNTSAHGDNDTDQHWLATVETSAMPDTGSRNDDIVTSRENTKNDVAGKLTQYEDYSSILS